jgi:hypothetical protein
VAHRSPRRLRRSRAMRNGRNLNNCCSAQHHGGVGRGCNCERLQSSDRPRAASGKTEKVTT